MMMMMISRQRRLSNRQRRTIMIVIILFVPVLIYIISARNTVKYNYWSITTTTSSSEEKMKIKPVPFLDGPSKKKKKNNNNNNGGGGGGNDDDDRLSLLWWEPYIDYVAFPFSIRKSNQNHDWCVVIDVDDNDNNADTDASGSGNNNNNNKNNKIGLWFIKNYKSASSTGAGITARIAYNNNNKNNKNNNDDDDAKQQQQQQQPCIYKANHDFADRGNHYKYGRDHNHNFLWSIVRHPSSRVISLYFYFRQQPPLSPTMTKATTTTTTTTGDTDDNNNNNINMNIFHAVAASEKNSQVSLLNPSNERPWDHHTSTTKRKTKYNDAATTVKSIFHYYDFIAVQERLEESLVVLKLLMNLNMWDIIVLPSKQKGSYAINPTGKCTKIPNPSTSTLSELQDYLLSSNNNNNNNNGRHNNKNNIGDGSFFIRNNYDYLLHSAANKSLDMTIDKLGRTKVEREVIQYRQLQQLAITKCYDQAIFPCNQQNGTRRSTVLSKLNCYQQDWGCGYPCIDRLMKEHEQQQQQHNM